MKNSFQTLKTLTTKSGTYGYYDLQELERKGVAEVSRLPFSIRVMLESLLRNEDGYQVTREDIEALARAVRERVFEAFGVTLVPEPVTVGMAWSGFVDRVF